MKKNTNKVKEKYNIQKGSITYSDLNKPAKPLFSKKYLIAGKPDYIVNKDGRDIPVELKTGSCKTPRKNHILQLAAYCHLLEEKYGQFVPYGILVYNNREVYNIEFNPKIRFELESTIKKMRGILKTNRIELNHNDKNRCKNCSMRKYCKQKIN